MNFRIEKMTRFSRVRRTVALAGVAAATALACGAALAQDFPSKPITIVIPTTPGNTMDVIARVVGNEMSRLLGQPVVVENRPGANQIITLERIAKTAPADGYTIGIVGMDGVALLPAVVKPQSMRFDVDKDITFISDLGEARYVLAGSNDRPWKNFQQLITYAKANPGKLNYGASVAQIRVPVIKIMQETGTDMVHVPFNGGAPYLTGVAGGVVDFGFIGETPAKNLSAKIQYLAVTGDKRLSYRPDVPTLNELGIKGINGPSYSMIVRSGMPKPVFDKLAATVAQVLESPETQAALAKQDVTVLPNKTEAATRRFQEMTRVYTESAKKAGIQPE